MLRFHAIDASVPASHLGESQTMQDRSHSWGDLMSVQKRAPETHPPPTTAKSATGRDRPVGISARELLERWRIVPSVDRVAFRRDIDRIFRPG